MFCLIISPAHLWYASVSRLLSTPQADIFSKYINYLVSKADSSRRTKAKEASVFKENLRGSKLNLVSWTQTCLQMIASVVK